MNNFISISALAPVVRQSIDSFAETLQTEKETYTTTEGIGFDNASFTLTGSKNYLIDWFQKGLARDVTWKDPQSGIAFEGFVNRLMLNLDANTLTRSLDGMANRILYIYTPLDTTKDPPTAGAQTPIIENDTSSQDKWGIKTVLVSGNECPAATAADQAVYELYVRKHITKTETVTLGVGKALSLQVELRGYAYMGNWFAYSDAAGSGTTTADAMIKLILAADPNSVLSTEDHNIDTCATVIDKYSDGKRGGWKMIQDIASRGLETGGVGYPWSVGVYEGRRTTYKAMEYIDDNGILLSTNKRTAMHRQLESVPDLILDESGSEIMPWAVRPDSLLYTEGIPGRPIIVKQVKFTAPHKVVISGTDRLLPVTIKWECG